MKIRALCFALFALLALAAPVWCTDITVTAQTIPGFYPNGLSTAVSITGNATNSTVTVTSANLFQQSWVGLGGFTIEIGGARYTVANVTSRSSLTLTSNYTGPSGPNTVTFFPYIEIRIFSSQPFFPAGSNQPVPTGTMDSGPFFRRYAASVIQESGTQTLYWPQMVIPATTDGTPRNDAKYTIGFFSSTGGKVQGPSNPWACGSASQFYIKYHVSEFPITTQSWKQICEYNQAPLQIPFPSQNVTLNQFNATLPICQPGKLAGYTSAGQPQKCISIGAHLIFDTPSATLSSDGGGLAFGSLYTFIAADYARLLGTGFLDVDANASNRAIDLTQQPVGPYGLQVKKGDTTGNIVTVTYGGSTVRLTAPGAWATWLPKFGGWQLFGAVSGGLTPGGGDLALVTAVASTTPATYLRPVNIAYLQVDATTAPQPVNLSTPGVRPVDVVKVDTTVNAITISYNATTYTLTAPGMSARFVPNGATWVLWSVDPTFSGYTVDGLTYVATSASVYNLGAGVGFVDCDPSSNAQTVNLGVPGGAPVEVKTISSANPVTVNFNTTSLTLPVAGKAVKFVPDAAGANWVLWAMN